MRAVCPDTCGACMDQLSASATNDDPSAPTIPAIYAGQLKTEGCASGAVPFLVARNPSVAFSAFEATTALGQSPLGSGDGECCDEECFVCDYLFHQWHTAGNSYSTLSCSVLTSQVIAVHYSSFVGYDCTGCACSLEHDNALLYPGFYCQNAS
jgi:hypothetical protein